MRSRAAVKQSMPQSRCGVFCYICYIIRGSNSRKLWIMLQTARPAAEGNEETWGWCYGSVSTAKLCLLHWLLPSHRSLMREAKNWCHVKNKMQNTKMFKAAAVELKTLQKLARLQILPCNNARISPFLSKVLVHARQSPNSPFGVFSCPPPHLLEQWQKKKF